MNGYGKDDWILTTSDKKWTGNGPNWDKYFQNRPKFCNLTKI